MHLQLITGVVRLHTPTRSYFSYCQFIVVVQTPNVALSMDESWVLRQWDVRAGKCVWTLPDQAPWLKLIRI